MMHQPDILSDTFSTLRLHANLYFHARFAGDFSIAVPQERRSIRFHLIREGSCHLRVPGREAVLLDTGDLAIIPNGASQILSARPDSTPVSLEQAMTTGSMEDGTLSFGKGEPQVRMLCGYARFDEAADHPVLTTLPSSMVLCPAVLQDEPCTHTALRLLAMESEQSAPGATGVLSRLLEVLLLHAVRHVAASGNTVQPGFLAALQDVRIARALQAMHGKPQAAWTIASLAGEAGMSRARFAERFGELVGVPPISYLTAWRLIKARSLMAGTSLSTEAIAARCGYASVTSFTRRFKQEYGMGPGAFRKTV